MLSSPSASFKLPSLYDDLELDCRLYFPHIKPDISVKGVAIFAHPYAPLGGSFDDHVVHSVGQLLSSAGLLLLTFNFRGADKSPGKTSWSGKGELGDYCTLYAFAVAFMNIEGILTHLDSRSAPGSPKSLPLLLLAGYSYGSMMTAHLPSVAVISNVLNKAQENSSEREIQLRAHELAQAFLGWSEARQHRGRSSLRGLETASFGGYESQQASSKISRDTSRRSIDRERVRHSIERVRQRLGSKDHRSSEEDKQLDTSLPEIEITAPRIAYLLVSPLLGAVSSLTTMFSSLRFERRDRNTTAARDANVTDIEAVLSRSSTLIVFGTDDHFTSSRKVKDWCESIKSRPASQMQFHEVEGAGHFWHAKEVNEQLLESITPWLGLLLN